MKPYQPKTGVKCGCKRGVQWDNCPACEGTGWQINFAAIRAMTAPKPAQRFLTVAEIEQLTQARTET